MMHEMTRVRWNSQVLEMGGWRHVMVAVRMMIRQTPVSRWRLG